jgi:hypothetical protein
MTDLLMRNEPLGLPKGSVRAIIALGIVGGSMMLVYVKNGDAPDWIISAFSTTFGFYFGSRASK